MEAMHTTDTVFKPSSSSACNRRPWACHQLNAMSARTRKRLQRRTKQARKQTSAEQALDTDTATQMRRANENVQEAFASGNPETLRENGDDMLEVKACSPRLRGSLLTLLLSCAFKVPVQHLLFNDSVVSAHLRILRCITCSNTQLQCAMNAGLSETDGSSAEEGTGTTRHTATAGAAAPPRRY